MKRFFANNFGDIRKTLSEPIYIALIVCFTRFDEYVSYLPYECLRIT